MRNTDSKDDVRQRLIETGAAIIHRQGYNGTGIQEVLAACGVPKGSFYHYFKSKEDFALAIVDHHAGRMAEGAHALFADPTRSPLERIRRFFTVFMGMFADPANPQGACGCPIGNLVQEMAAHHPAFRQRLDGVLCGMESSLAEALRQAREAGEIPARLDPARTARFILGSWQGAVLRAKAAGSADPLACCRDFILDEVLG